MKNKKNLAYILLEIGFSINFVAIVLLFIPFVKKESNYTLTYSGIGLFLFAAIFLATGFYLVIKENDKK